MGTSKSEAQLAREVLGILSGKETSTKLSLKKTKVRIKKLWPSFAGKLSKEHQSFIEGMGLSAPSPKKVHKTKETEDVQEEKKTTRKRSEVSGTKILQDLFKQSKKKLRSEVIAALIEGTGMKDYSASNYIAAAKREDSPYGFRLEETKREDGERELKRI